ncbi:MAG TPA: CarD family transcriptional regulator, partial [Stellaceae bacterium]|nr:CarD family transcriptional regulator [Stellaceae bacterium]
MTLSPLFASPSRFTIAGAPEGHDALILGQALEASGAPALLHICRDDQRMERLRQALSFFHGPLEVRVLPAWDCLPYDRVSPRPEIISQRIDTLTLLAETRVKHVILTTVNAAVQRVPPRRLFEDRVLRLGRGGRIALDRLLSFLAHNGYARTDTVREAGEVAVRGGIVDLFPAGAPSPVRLDFFGDVIEAMRRFDPLTQRGTEPLESIALKPVNEVLLDDAVIARFRSRYREQFGTVADDDPLYEAVSAGRRYIGMEHWLPLFYESLETVFDYLPGAAVTLDYQAEDIRRDRLAHIAECYATRHAALKAGGGTAAPYRPVRPDQLFLDERVWESMMAERAGAAFTPFRVPLAEAKVFDAGAQLAEGFAAARANPSINLFDAVRDHVVAAQKRGDRVLITAYSAGSAERLQSVLKDHHAPPVVEVTEWGALQSLAPELVGLAVLPLEQGYRIEGVELVTEQDILGDRLARPPKRRAKFDQFVAEVSGLAAGDLVVHAEHGIGRYEGLETLQVAGAPHDCLRILYAGDDKLFVPVENIEILSRFGPHTGETQLDRLGGVAWQSRKARVKRRIKDMAGALIAVAAERQLREGQVMPAPEGAYQEFAARFPYPETEDQDRAILDTLDDLNSGKPMDRLICGDVGFGKTEVALRAAFVAAMSGVQVAIIVPTTLLARQH